MNKKFLVFILLISFTLYSAEESCSSTSNKNVPQFTEKFGWEFEHQNTFWFTGLEWSSDSEYIITSSTDSAIRIWDGLGDVIKSWKYHGCTINCIASAHCYTAIAISYNDKENNPHLEILGVYSNYKNTVFSCIAGLSNFFNRNPNIKKITSICWCDYDCNLIFATSEGMLCTGSTSGCSHNLYVTTFKDKINLLASSSKNIFYLLSNNKTISYAKLNIRGDIEFSSDKFSNPDKISSMTLSHDLKCIACIVDNKIVIVTPSGMVLNEINTGDFYPKFISWSPDGTKLAIADNTKIKILVKS